MKVRVQGLKKGMSNIRSIVDETSEKQMNFAMKDLERVASETTPLDEGDLEKGGSHGVAKRGDSYLGHVRFEAISNKSKKWPNFNYAIWIHEQRYNLGKRSQAKAGGKGLSGKSYSVGRRYLTRPMWGEAPHYRKLIEGEIKKELRKG
jgi:hypothetical protein